MALRRFASVAGYHLDAIPLPFSPRLDTDAPGASIPPLRVRLRTRARNPRSKTSRGSESVSSATECRVGANVWILRMRVGADSSALCQNAATSGSISDITARSANPSMTAVSDTIAPPANGSNRTSERGLMPPSHVRMCGTSQVFPPGYRSGLRWGTDATFTAAIGEIGMSVS